MAQVTISKITFDATPSANQTVTIKHRLTSDPDISGSYTTDSTSVDVDVYGFLIPPFTITGLALGTSYTVKIINNCNASESQQEFTTSNCPDVNTITGTTGGGNPF